MPAWIRMPVPYRHQTPKSDHVTILPVVLTVQPFPCDRFYQVRCLQVFGKSISDCAEFMSLNLFEAKATVQGWVSLRKHLSTAFQSSLAPRSASSQRLHLFTKPLHTQISARRGTPSHAFVAGSSCSRRPDRQRQPPRCTKPRASTFGARPKKYSPGCSEHICW